MHFCYIKKVLSLNSERLPRILAEKVIELNLLWAKEWSNLCNVLQFSPPNNSNLLCFYWKEIICLLKIKDKNDFTTTALNSQFHDLYSQLNYDVTPVLTAEFSSRATSLIIRARGGILDLNARSFKNNTDGICTICNMHESENTFHFIGICPVYTEFRYIYFGQASLSFNEVLNILNGTNFNSLYKYLETCIKYRNLILNEFDV